MLKGKKKIRKTPYIVLTLLLGDMALLLFFYYLIDYFVSN